MLAPVTAAHAAVAEVVDDKANVTLPSLCAEVQELVGPNTLLRKHEVLRVGVYGALVYPSSSDHTSRSTLDNRSWIEPYVANSPAT